MTNWGAVPPPGGPYPQQPPAQGPIPGALPNPAFGGPVPGGSGFGNPVPAGPMPDPAFGPVPTGPPFGGPVPGAPLSGPGGAPFGGPVPGTPLSGPGGAPFGGPVPGTPLSGPAPFGGAVPGAPLPGPGGSPPGYPPQWPGRPQPGYWPAQAAPRVRSGVLVGVSLWRLVIVIFAFVGFTLAVSGGTGDAEFAALSQQASLLTAVCYLILLLYPLFTGGRRHEPVRPWLRGALVVLLSLVSVTFLTMLGGELNETWSLFEHLLTPLAVLADWLFVGRDQRAVRWWFPFTWLAFPLAYLLFYIAYVGGTGEPIYPFLDPGDGDFVGVVFGFLAAVLAFGFVIYGIGKLKGAISDGATHNGGRPPVPPGYPMPYPQPPQAQPRAWGPPPAR